MQHTQPLSSDKDGIARDQSSRADDTNYRVLLIDDRPEVLEPIAVSLSMADFLVWSTTHGSDLVHLVELVNPDVLVADVIMDEIDTLDVLPALRKSHPNLKIIAISGNPHLLTLARKHGADHVLAKPFDTRKLSALIKTAMQ